MKAFTVYIYLNTFLLLYSQQQHSVLLKVSKYFWTEKPNVCRTATRMTAYCVAREGSQQNTESTSRVFLNLSGATDPPLNLVGIADHLPNIYVY
jgi:hypothetical protein